MVARAVIRILPVEHGFAVVRGGHGVLRVPLHHALAGLIVLVPTRVAWMTFSDQPPRAGDDGENGFWAFSQITMKKVTY